MGKQTSGQVAFSREQEVLDQIRRVLDAETPTEGQPGDPTYRAELERMANHYEQLLRESQLLTSVGDRLQRKLKSANMQLQDKNDQIERINQSLEAKNEELRITIDELTRARANRKAQTFILFMAIVLFLASELLEGIIESYIKTWLNNTSAAMSDFIVILSKVPLVFMLKPLETFLEKFYLRKAMERNRRSIVEKTLNDTQYSAES